MTIAKLGHVALVTPDLERSVWFFRDVVGLEEVERENGTVFLRSWGDFEHHSLSLTAGSTAEVDHIGWRTSAAEHVEEFAQALTEQGVDLRRVEAGEERGQGEAVRFRIPGAGHRFELYYEIAKPASDAGTRSRLKNNAHRAWDHGVSPRRIDHVNLFTDDVGGAERWLSDNLGFKTREYMTVGGTVVGTWMAVTTLVHDLAIMTDPGGRPGRFHHVAYYLDNWQDVLRGMDVLREHGVDIDLGPGRHGISQAFFCYVKDPGSGHRVELFSGGYHIFDPDWEAVEWTQDDMKEALIWWGPDYLPGQGSPLDDTTEG